MVHTGYGPLRTLYTLVYNRPEAVHLPYTAVHLLYMPYTVPYTCCTPPYRPAVHQQLVNPYRPAVHPWYTRCTPAVRRCTPAVHLPYTVLPAVQTPYFRTVWLNIKNTEQTPTYGRLTPTHRQPLPAVHLCTSVCCWPVVHRWHLRTVGTGSLPTGPNSTDGPQLLPAVHRWYSVVHRPFCTLWYSVACNPDLQPPDVAGLPPTVHAAVQLDHRRRWTTDDGWRIMNKWSVSWGMSRRHTLAADRYWREVQKWYIYANLVLIIYLLIIYG